MTLIPHISAAPSMPGLVRPLPPELLDGVLDAVMAMPDATARAEIVLSLVDELYACVAWLQAGDGGAVELASLSNVTDAARAHQVWLATHLAPARSGADTAR